MLLLLARWLHNTHPNCTIIARSSTNTVDLYASIWPQTTGFNTRREYSSLATTSARRCSTCYGRDGSIASRSINREKHIEALVIFKKVQFALDILTDTNFIAELKQMSGSGKTEQEHVPHFLHKTWTGSFWTFHVVVMQIRGKEMYRKSVLRLDLLLFFTILGIQRLFSVKYLFTWQKVSRWPFHPCTIFEAHLIMLINSLRFSEV